MGDSKGLSHDTSVKYVIKKKRKIKRENTQVACDPLGTSEILRVKLWQHKFKIREVERYCTDTYRLTIIWDGTTQRRFTNKQCPSEESAPKALINVIIKIQSSEHVSQDEWVWPIRYRCKSLSIQNFAELHSVCSLIKCIVNSAM